MRISALVQKHSLFILCIVLTSCEFSVFQVRVVSQQLDAKGKRVDVPDEWEPQERFYGNEFKVISQHLRE